jgi:hypothetical protein
MLYSAVSSVQHQITLELKVPSILKNIVLNPCLSWLRDLGCANVRKVTQTIPHASAHQDAVKGTNVITCMLKTKKLEI